MPIRNLVEIQRLTRFELCKQYQPPLKMDDINNHTSGIERVVDLLIESRCLLLITGAGISADSGLPTYRGIGGLYNVNDTEEGMPLIGIEFMSPEKLKAELPSHVMDQIEEEIYSFDEHLRKMLLKLSRKLHKLLNFQIRIDLHCTEIEMLVDKNKFHLRFHLL